MKKTLLVDCSAAPCWQGNSGEKADANAEGTGTFATDVEAPKQANDVLNAKFAEMQTTHQQQLVQVQQTADEKVGAAKVKVSTGSERPSMRSSSFHKSCEGTFLLGSGGLPGNDVMGATPPSYVRAALGLYPIGADGHPGIRRVGHPVVLPCGATSVTPLSACPELFIFARPSFRPTTPWWASAAGNG